MTPFIRSTLEQARSSYGYRNQSCLIGGGGKVQWQGSPGKRHKDAWNCFYMKNVGAPAVMRYGIHRYRYLCIALYIN